MHAADIAEDVSRRDDWISELKVGDSEAVALIVRRLAAECHEFALSSHIPCSSVEHQLTLVLDVLSGNLCHLIRCIPVVATGATDIGGVRIDFSPEGYRFLAETTKNLMASAVN